MIHASIPVDTGRRWKKDSPIAMINGYGLFRVMTTKRYEIAIEGSLDGDEWREYVFRWKPGPVERAPGFVAPHQPRLDWQMWFAALNPRGHVHWLEPLMLRILEDSEDVLALLGADPFDGERPRYVRLRMDEYLFTTSEERAATGAWWRRESRGLLTAPVSLPEGERGGGALSSDPHAAPPYARAALASCGALDHDVAPSSSGLSA